VTASRNKVGNSTLSTSRRDTEQAQFSAGRSFSTTAYVKSFGGNSDTLAIFTRLLKDLLHSLHTSIVHFSKQREAQSTMAPKLQIAKTFAAAVKEGNKNISGFFNVKRKP
jgi:hypothetical protein